MAAEQICCFFCLSAHFLLVSAYFQFKKMQIRIANAAVNQSATAFLYVPLRTTSLIFFFAEDFINTVVFDISEQVLDFIHAFQRYAQFSQRDQRNLAGGFKSLDAAEAHVASLTQLLLRKITPFADSTQTFSQCHIDLFRSFPNEFHRYLQ